MIDIKAAVKTALTLLVIGGLVFLVLVTGGAALSWIGVIFLGAMVIVGIYLYWLM
jgi:hypothetical protein